MVAKYRYRAENAGKLTAKRMAEIPEKMGTDHVFMKGAKRRPEKRGLSPIFPCPLFFPKPVQHHYFHPKTVRRSIKLESKH